VQGGDFPAFRESLPPRDYFTDEIRRQLSAPSARRSSSAAA
jgi:penicillin-binding protein 1A